MSASLTIDHIWPLWSWFSKPKIPAPPPPPPPVVTPAPASVEEDAAAKQAGAEERRRLLRRKGRGSTVLTGGTGVTETPTAGAKTLLGQ